MPHAWRLFAMIAALLVGLLAAKSGVAVGGDTEDLEGYRVAYSSRVLFEISRADARAALELLTRELGRQAQYTPGTKAIIYEDLSTLAADLRARKVDFVALTILDFMKYRDEMMIEPALFGTKGGKVVDEMILVVRRDSGLDRLEKLAGRKISFMAGAGDLATIWLDILLARSGLPPTERFFGAMNEAGNAHKTLFPVFFRQVDACVMNRNAYTTAAELNPQLGKDLVVVATSPGFPVGVSCFQKNLPKSKKDRLLSSYEDLIQTPKGRQILTLFRIDGVRRSEPRYLEAIEALLREHAALKNTARRQ